MVPPLRRLVSLSVAAFAALLTFGLIFGAQTTRESYAVVVFGVQAIFTVVWIIATRPPAPRIAAGVGLLTAVVADVGAVWSDHPSLTPLGYAVAAGFLFGVTGQLARRTGRIRVTESLSTSLVVVLGVVAYASLVVLVRQPLGTQAVVVGLVGGGGGIAVARLCDVLRSSPRVAPQVPRGVIGVVVGAMAGTAAAGYLGGNMVGLSPRNAVLTGLATALIAVLTDLAVAYAEAGRRLAGDVPVLWLARHMQGPLAGLALAAPAIYLLSVLLLIPGLR